MKRLMSSFRTLLLVLFIPFLVISCGEEEKSDNKPTVSNSSVQTCQTGLNVDHKVSIRNDRLQTIVVAVDGDFNNILVAIESGETCEVDKTGLSGELVLLKVADYADASADPDSAEILTSRLFLRAPKGGSNDTWTILSGFGYAFLENLDDRILNIRKDSRLGESFGFINSNSEQQLDLPKGSPLTLVAFPLTSDGELLSTPTNVMTNLLPNSNVANAQANKRLIGVASVDLALTNYSDHNVAIKLATESEFLINENTDNEIIQPNNVGNLTVQFPSNEDGLGSIGSQTIQAFIGSQGEFDPSLFSFSTSVSLTYEKNTTYSAIFDGSTINLPTSNSDDPVTNDPTTRFIKLVANGNRLSIQNADWSDTGTEESGTKWSCVEDTDTGLVWENKVNDENSVHHKYNYYHWGGIGTRGSSGYHYGDWDVLVNAANNANLCGFNDWRVPTLEELKTIVDNGRSDPSIDVHYFPNTLSAGYWSSSPSSYDAWTVYFDNGNDNHNYRYDLNRVRLVRSSQ